MNFPRTHIRGSRVHLELCLGRAAGKLIWQVTGKANFLFILQDAILSLDIFITPVLSSLKPPKSMRQGQGETDKGAQVSCVSLDIPRPYLPRPGGSEQPA